MDLINEVFVLFATYHLYCFTDFMTDEANQKICGYSLMLLIVINIVINIGLVVIQTALLFINKLKLKFLQRKHRKDVKKELEK